MATTDCEPRTDPTLEEFTQLVLLGGEALEQRWIDEHTPDARRRMCRGCRTVVTDGRCYFNRAAHRAREIRTRKGGSK